MTEPPLWTNTSLLTRPSLAVGWPAELNQHLRVFALTGRQKETGFERVRILPIVPRDEFDLKIIGEAMRDPTLAAEGKHKY